MSRNNLDLETSPYLLQHKDNPVHWQAWGDAAFETAREAGKPIMLSVGYAACHWCHVMAHESFENDTIAALMNDLFVNVKVDREERPDVDAIYQQALALTGGHGGWPLTMFMTPNGEPFWGGTYFPIHPAYGRPGFADVLRRVSEVYQGDTEAVRKNADALRDGLKKLAAPDPDLESLEITDSIMDQVARHLVKETDLSHGGIGGAPKFPQPYAYELVWRAYLRTGDTAFQQAAEVTLNHMCQGGIYDHLGGGFARYSTDDEWLAPHFEKMLYDNAQLIDLLTLVWQTTNSNLYERRVRETVAWTLREMVADGGGFAATFDADSEGEEGKFYVWQDTEIDRLLGTKATAFKAVYDVLPGGNWEGKTILRRTSMTLLGDAEEAALQTSRQILLDERAERVRPGWDDKVLADWNGLMITALVHASLAFNEPSWLDAAKRAFAFIVGAMSDGDRLFHSYRKGQAKHIAMLDDYANMSRAALALYEATGEASYLRRASAWVVVLDRHYWDDDAGGYYLTADNATDLILRQRTCHDNATPAGNGIMGDVLARMWLLTGQNCYRDQAERLFGAFSGELRRNFFPMATFLNAFSLMLNAVQVVVVGRRGEATTEQLLRAILRRGLPDRVLQVIEPDGTLPATHPARGKMQINGNATAYICIGPTCSPPITEPDGLDDILPRAAATP